MRKVRIVLLGLVILLLLAALAVGIFTYRAVEDAEDAQAAVYAQYIQLLDCAEDSTLTVTENGVTIGVYSMADLGLWEDAKASVDAQFSETDRMQPDDFAALTIQEKLDWNQETHPQASSVPVNMDRFDASRVLRDLRQLPRTAAENAYAYFQNGAYHITPEVPGNELAEAPVLEALAARAAALEITGSQPAAATLELTDCDCYVQPEITAANGDFDYDAMLENALARMTVTLDFHEDQISLTGQDLALLVHSGSDGKLEVQPALDTLLSDLAETHREEHTPYIFQSYAAGPVPIDFLTCTYRVDTDALKAALTEALTNLKSAAVEVPYLCTDGVDEDGAPFVLGDTYVEVDIANQQLTFYKDGELIVHTDVVTGFRNWRETPTGFYTVQNKDTGCWLSGPDYNVYVEYWVGFIGTLYGLHDASWRDEFGGKIYAKNGSHGCVNIPSDAMALIFESIDLGTPILIYDLND